ncbi:MAG: GLUG motif-containing protein [Acetobacterium sp.]|uniref:GLUG motif-containing protein n=1 Tax=Acetobacterium sp. TaxID=1872094 RepID=UPI0032423B27
MKRKIIGILVMVAMMGMLGAMPVMAGEITAPDNYVFTTDASGVIQIGGVEALTEFSKYVNDEGGNPAANAVLTTDIALNATDDWEQWGPETTGLTAWTPIGNWMNQYTGKFDGDNHTISGIYLVGNCNADGQGLFGECRGEIKNLKVAASCFNVRSMAGGIAGIMHGGSITNCQVEANLVGITPVAERIGGIAGYVDENTSITNCYSTANVNGNQYVGGIIGYMNGGRVENCANTGTIVGNSSVGGIVGFSSASSIANCYQTGAVTGGDALTGGILGKNNSTANCRNCYYLSGSAVYGDLAAPTIAVGIGNTTTDVAGQTVAKTDAAFVSGEIAWRLQKGQTVPTDPHWGQLLPVEPLPLLKGSDPVCQVSFAADNGMVTAATAYVNQNGTVTPPPPSAGYVWQDSSQAVFTAATTVTGDISVRCEIATLPTAAAVYGTKLRDIAFSGGSVPTANWSWSASATDLDSLLAVGNDLDYSATYTPTDATFDTKTVAIVPTITPRSLEAAGVTISNPPNVNYSGAAIEPLLTVVDSGAVITTADYSISYADNVNPGTATVTISGQGNYQGTVFRAFTITASGGGGGGYTPPGMSGITVTPRVISFDPSGQITVDISGLPPEAKVFYSLDGITYSTTPPAITRAGEYLLYLRITCNGYQDFNTQTLVRVGKQSPPKVGELELPLPPKLREYTILLGQPLPADRGLTQYQVELIDDPEALLDGPPTIAADGAMTCNFRRPLNNADVETSQMDDQATARESDGLTTAARTATITVLVTMENYEDTTLTVVVSEAEPIGLRYQTHIQDYGWENDWVTAGALSGTAGQSKRLEALKVELTGDVPAGASIETAVHVQNQGDLGPFAMGSAAGTSGLGLRLENICLTLTNLPGYSLRYNVHVQNQGWLRDEADPSSWFTSGEVAGTAGQSLRLEGIRMVLVEDE